MARSSFSSGVSWVSPLGVTLPTMMLPALTSAPMRMTPLSSRSRSAFSEMLGISRVISSGPSLVSRDSISNSSICDGGVVILLDHLLGDQDRVFEVVAAPGHEGDQHVASEGKFALIGTGAIGDHLALEHAVALADDRPLRDAGVLVGALEFDELVDVGTDLARELGGMVLALDAHDDAFGIDGIDDAVAARQHHRAGIAGGDALHAGAYDRRLGAQQRAPIGAACSRPSSARLASSCSRKGTSEAATETSCLGLTST